MRSNEMNWEDELKKPSRIVEIPPQGHHRTKGSILRNMFVYGATALTLVGIVGLLALGLVGIYKLLEWMIAL